MNIRNNNNYSKVWYPLRVTYSRELKVKSELDKLNIESFVPMKYETKEIGGVKQTKLVSAIHNLIFIHDTKEMIDELKLKFSSELRYIIDKALKQPIIIPDKQMQDFIAIATAECDGVLFLSLEESRLKRGDRVRITQGIFKGVEGKFVRIKRGLRVVVELDNLTAIATTSLPPSIVEKIE